VGDDLLEELREAIGDTYDIERELGRGGMSLVFAATERALSRRVAIKVVRPELAGGVNTERFRREILVAASLQHPHIVPLLNTGIAGELLYYVMPLVEGPSLRDYLEREKHLRIDEAVRITREVAGALEYAHRRGVIHRDIKPGNILLQDGHAQVTDFGIALAVEAAGGDRLTGTGFSLGTPQYMSPEQASGGRAIDARTDVYALGCVLYEMLAGEPPITGPTTPAIVARLMYEEPRPVTSVRKSVPVALESVLLRALAKLPADRYGSIAEFSSALDDPAVTERMPAITPQPIPIATGHWRRWAPTLVGLLIAVLAVAAWLVVRPGSARPATVARFVMSFAPGEEPGLQFYGTSFTLSRDGSRVAYIANTSTGWRLLVRSRDQLRATPVLGGENVYAPAFSPDGQSLAFVTGDPGALKVVSLTGGSPVTLVNDGVMVVHVFWGSDGFLYYTDVTGALVRVRARGGSTGSGGSTPEVIARPDTARGQRWFTHPDVADDGSVVVFTTWPTVPSGSGREPSVAAVRLPAGEVRVLTSGMNGHLDAPGQLIFVDREYNLLAAPFDARQPGLRGAARGLDLRVAPAPDGTALFTLARDGTLLYAEGEEATRQRPAWATRDGRLAYVDTTWNARISSVALSPDGKRLAVALGDRGGTDIWVKALDRGPLTRLTHWGSQTYRPAWSSDGRSVTFVSNHGGIQKLFSVPADGSGEPSVLAAPATGVDEGGWSPDGRWLIVRSGVGVRRDIIGFRPGSSTPVPLVVTAFEEFSPAVSQDGRWIAYVSDESQRPEVYVRPFPETAGARWQVSSAGGLEPVWARNGRELYYRSSAGDLITAMITAGPAFQVESQRTLFRAQRLHSEVFHQTYAVAPDGRFLFVEGKFESSAALVRVENWLAELQRRMSW